MADGQDPVLEMTKTLLEVTWHVVHLVDSGRATVGSLLQYQEVAYVDELRETCSLLRATLQYHHGLARDIINRQVNPEVVATLSHLLVEVDSCCGPVDIRSEVLQDGAMLVVPTGVIHMVDCMACHLEQAEYAVAAMNADNIDVHFGRVYDALNAMRRMADIYMIHARGLEWRQVNWEVFAVLESIVLEIETEDYDAEAIVLF